jgi:hypothetical protein
LLQSIQQRFGPSGPEAVEVRIDQADADTLRWSEPLLSAARIESVVEHDD